MPVAAPEGLFSTAVTSGSAAPEAVDPDAVSKTISRRTLFRAAASTVAVTAVGAGLGSAPAVAAPAPSGGDRLPRPVRELEEKILQGMRTYAIPGAALGVWYRGREYVRGYGVTNLDTPVPVDGDTVFRIASNTKPFTGTVAMRLVEAGRLDLDRTVRTYLPGFRTADESASARVTVRQLLNHTAGWYGDYFEDTGSGDDALARYVAAMAVVPQLTEPGRVFSYNNAAVSLAGRIIEVITKLPYERAVREMLIDPLGLAHSRFFAEELAGFKVADPHTIVDGKVVADPALLALPRAINPAGGLFASARDLIRFARFHLGDGRAPGGGPRLLRRNSLRAMRSRPGPGGTIGTELTGVGVNWLLRPTAQGVRIAQHGGDLPGEHSGFLMVPDRDFAFTLLTNSDSGPALVAELFVDDWALRRLAGVTNPPAVPRALPDRALAPYTGRYVLEDIGPGGTPTRVEIELTAQDGALAVYVDGEVYARLVFYRRDHVLATDPEGNGFGERYDFVRDGYGRVAWLRFGGRLIRHLPAGGGTPAARGRSGRPRLPLPFSLPRHLG